MTTQQKKLVEGTDIELYDQAKWSRATVADGKWLQNETLEPISSNDRILASAIHDTSANLTTYIDDSIDEVYENLSAISVDVYNKINYVSATVDNNAVAFQNLVEYVSGDLRDQIFNTSSFLQNEIDTSTQDLRNEISATSSFLQNEIDTLEAATDNKITALSSTVSSNYLSANGTAVQSGHNIVISANPTEPKILIKTSDNVTFTGISATTLSATTAYGSSAKFDNISSTNLTALTAQGNSAKFTNISSTNLTALTAQGNQASYTNISATTLSGATTSINIDNLISAATAGAVSYSGKNGIQINDHDIMLSAKMSAIGNGITNNSAISLSSFKLAADTGINFNATTDTLGISVSSSIINSAKSGQSAYNWLTANTDGNSAKWAKNATSATNAANADSATSAYNAQNLGGVSSTNIISSAEFGKSAYNWLTANTDGNSAKWAKNATNADSATSAYNAQNLGGVSSTNIISSAEFGKDAWNTLSSATFTANGTTAKLSGGFNLSAGQGITIIHNAGEQKIGISAEGTSYTTGRGIAINGTVISVKDEFVPWSAEDAPIGTNNNALNTAFAQGTNNIATNASFAQGDSSRAGDKSFSQGTNNSASFISFAQGELNGANRDSFAQGYNNTAYYYSFAQGSANNASSYSFAQGINNSSDSYSFTQGASNTAKTYSFSQGHENIATGLSFANGMSNIAGNNSFTQGHENSADSFSFAVGMDNIASSFAFAQGDSNNVKDYAFAQGASNTANKYSVAIGQWCSAYEYGQAFGDSTVISGGMAIGNCNASTAGVAFVIGNGINNNNRHDLFSINHSGDITINWSASDPNVSPDTITGETIIGGYYVNTKYNTVGGTGQDTTAQATWIDMMSNQVRFAYSADLAHSAEKVLGGPAGDTLQPVYLTTSGTIQSCGTINRAVDIEVISTASGTEGNVGTLDTSMEQIAVDTIVLQPKEATEQGEHNNLNINRLIKGKVYKVFMVSSSLSWSLYLQRINANGIVQQFVVIDTNGRHNNNNGWIAEGMRQSGYNTSSTIYLIRTDNDKILIMYGY